MSSRGRVTSHYAVSVIVLTLLVAAALRLWGLPGIPPGPHYDEAANGILAAEITNGDKTPIFIPSYTGKEVLFFYGAAAAMRILGVGLLALRLTSALAGLLTVAASAWLTYELFADDYSNNNPGGAPWLAALTAALLATSFWHVLLSRVGFRAVTQPLLQALTLAALWRGLRRDDVRWLLLGGLFCGLVGYTYLAARAFPIPLGITLVVLLIADVGHRRRRLTQIALFGLAALFSFAPLGLYFLRHPDAFTTRIGQVGPGSDWTAALNGIVSAFKMLFWQGDPYIRFNLPQRPLFGPVVALLFVVGLAVTVWRLLRPQTTNRASIPGLSRAREILLLVWIPAMLLPTALAVGEISPSNLRAVGLIPLIFIFPARGAWWVANCVSRFPGPPLRGEAEGGTFHASLAPGAKRKGVRFTFLLILFATAFMTTRAYFYEYAPRTDLYEASDGDLADIAAYLNQSPISNTIYVGSIHYRHPTLAFLADAYPQIKWLVGASTIVYPAGGEALYLFPRSARPDADWLTRYLSDATPVQATTAADGAPAFNGYHLLAPPPLSDEVLADFGGVARLLSYQVERAVSGAEADVTLVWQILAPPPHADLIPFYHLVDPWGSRWGQTEPFHYGAADWTPGEVVVDRIRTPIAAGAPPGDYVLQAGLYSQSAATRLSIVDADENYAGSTAPLTVTVARAETPPNPEALGIRQRLDLETGVGLTLLGANLDTAQARPGERVHLTLFWRAGQVSADYAVNLFLSGVDGADLALYSGAPVHGVYPTSRWREGEIVVDRYNPRLPLVAADARPGDYALALTITGTDGDTTLDSLVLGQLTLVATDRKFEMPPIQYSHPFPLRPEGGDQGHATLGDQIEFLGYDLDLSDAHPGGTIHLTLYWRALTEMDTGYTVFTHLLDPDGNVPTQQDNQPLNGTYPTTLWLPGEIISDPYHIALPADLPPSDYAIEIGFYIAESGLRLDDPILLDTAVSVLP